MKDWDWHAILTWAFMLVAIALMGVAYALMLETAGFFNPVR